MFSDERLLKIINKHKCKAPDYCYCSSMDLEPNEECPIHGFPSKRQNCMICGKFVYRSNN